MSCKKMIIDDPGILDSSSDSSDALKDKGIFYITGAIESDSLKDIHQNILLKHLDPSWKDDIQLFINSPGGSCAEMWSLIDLLDYIRMDVRTVGMGEICSAGTMLVAAGTKGKRLLTANATVMVHGFSTVVYGNYHQLTSEFKGIQQEHDREVEFWIKTSNYKNKNDVEKHLLNGMDEYMNSKLAVHHGIVDGIVGQQKGIKKKVRRRK